MSNYVSLDEAAKILGVTTDALIEMRSRGEIFGYRDGTSWKFKPEEIERVESELGGDALDEEAGGSSILISERQAGPSGSKTGSTIGKGSDVGLDSDLKRTADGGSSGSDVALVSDPSSDSGVKLVSRSKKPSGDDSGIQLDADSKEGSSVTGGSDLRMSEDGGSGGEIDLGSDLKLMADSPDASGIDLLKSLGSSVLDSQLDAKLGSSKSGGGTAGSGSLELGDELELAQDDEDDLVLGSDSGVGLGSESGINLMSPSDSGLSLEDEPLDLAGTGISGLDLGGEVGSGIGSGSKSGVASGLGSGALVDFQQEEEFQLTPSGGIDTDDDSSSQVIELVDSDSFGAGMPDADMGAVEEAGFGDGLDEMNMGAEGMGGAVAMRGAPETPYSGLQVGMLAMILLLMGMCGILTSDILRNLWQWDGQTDYSTGLTSMLVKAIGGS